MKKTITDKHQHDPIMLSTVAPNFLDPKLEGRRMFAEAWGTFLLVLSAAGASIVAATTGKMSSNIAAITPGIMVMAVIYFMGSVSGAHLNPAVTIAFALRRNFPWSRVGGYILAQFIGGLCAAAFLYYLFGKEGNLGATHPAVGIIALKALLLEIILTATLVNIILGTASGARNVGTNGAIAVGGYIALAGLWAEPITGASMNPIRSLAPDIVRGDFQYSWIYVAGPLLGAGIGVLFEWILKGKPSYEGNRIAQGNGQ